MKKYIFFISLILYSCNNVNDFSHNEKQIFGKDLEIGCLVGQPVEISCIDSILLFYDKYDKQTITIYDIKNEQFVRRFLNEGRAPGEVIVPLKLFTSERNKKLYVFQLQSGILYEYNIMDIIQSNDEVTNYKKYLFEDRPAIIKMYNKGFIGIGIYDDNRYHIYSQNGNFVASYGDYPFNGNNLNANDRFIIYQGSLCANPENNFFSMGSSYCDNLEFYRIENNHPVLIKKYETYDVKAQYKERIYINDDCIMNYKASYGSEKYCYMLYSGKTYEENNKHTYGGRKLIVFDWRGNYVKSFIADMDIISFCVDEKNNNVYAVTLDKGGFKITRFNF
ncbi:MAG: BF3164 family lipoprotein [Bacteroidales bacterium]